MKISNSNKLNLSYYLNEDHIPTVFDIINEDKNITVLHIDFNDVNEEDIVSILIFRLNELQKTEKRSNKNTEAIIALHEALDSFNLVYNMNPRKNGDTE